MTITKPETKIARALDWLIDTFPCFTSIRASWTVLENNQIPTMATDGKRLLWNRSFVDWMTNEETRWVTLHEAGHVFLGHHFRCLGADKETRNKALDLALNWLIETTCPPRLRSMGCFPGSGTFASLPGNRDAEFYLKALQQSEEEQEAPENEQNEPENDPEGDEGSDSQPEDSEGSESDSEDSEGEEDSTEGNSEQSESTEGEGEGEGEGQPKTWDPSSGKPGDIGEVLEVSPEEAEQAEEKWEEIVSEGILAAEMAGRLPGWAKELANQIAAKNQVRWYQRLKSLMQEASDNGSSYDRPNRKTSWMSDCILPSNFERDNGRGVVLLDTSGSMSPDQLNSVLTRIEEIVREFPNAEVDLLQCDTRLAGREITFKAQDFPIKVPVEWYGRGGTDMNPALREISYKKAAKEWSWVIIVSDMFWNVQGAIDTGLPTFFVKTSPGSEWYQRPRFGQCLEAA